MEREPAMRLELSILAGKYAVCRLAKDAPIPPWLHNDYWWSVTRTADELSVICRESVVPPSVPSEHGWRVLAVKGPFPFDTIGVLASLSGVLARAVVPLLAVSTYDTDYLLVKEVRLLNAVEALTNAGHRVNREGGDG